MLYEIVPSITSQASSSCSTNHSDGLQWLPHTLKKKLNDADLLFLEQQQSALLQGARQQIAHDLHDNTLQTLTALSYQLSMLQLGNSAVTKKDLHALQGEVKKALKQLRSDIHGLRSPDNNKLSINDSLKQYVTKLEHELPLPIIEQTFDDAAETLPAPLRHCVAKVLKVGLRNAVKHAQARHVWLRLFFHNERVITKVTDDGEGIPNIERQTLVRQPQFRLTGLADAAAPLQGRIFVCSRQGEGTVLISVLPLKVIHG